MVYSFHQVNFPVTHTFFSLAKGRLIDIAKKAGVSVSTVPLILNNKAEELRTEELRISNDLIKKVQKVAHLAGYVPNHVAVSLRTGKTKVICFIVEDFSNPFFAEITSLIEARGTRVSIGMFKYCKRSS